MTILDLFSPSDRIEHIEHFCNIELSFKMMQHFAFSTSETPGSSISSLVLQDFILTHFGDMSCLNFFLCSISQVFAKFRFHQKNHASKVEKNDQNCTGFILRQTRSILPPLSFFDHF